MRKWWFFFRLGRTSGWRLLPDGRIRREVTSEVVRQTPLTAVASTGKKQFSVADYQLAGEKLGFPSRGFASHPFILEVALATDALPDHNKQLRKKLLKATKLSPDDSTSLTTEIALSPPTAETRNDNKS